MRAECGDVGQFRLADRDVVLLTGAEANELFFRAPEEVLDQAEAYPFMTPIFGEGVVFDAPPERRREMLHNQALRDKFMRGHAATIADEVEGMVGTWGERGHHRPPRLVRRAHHLHVLGLPHREASSATSSTAASPSSTTTSSRAPTPSPMSTPTPPSRASAAATRHGSGSWTWCRGSWTAGHKGLAATDDDRDLLDVLMSIRDEDGTPRFRTDMVTGMFISMMFAGHHTTSGTAAWTLIELLRHPEELAAVRAELDELYAHGEEVSYQALRAMPRLESAIKEALRLHPPLILVLRVVKEELEVQGYAVAPGKLVGASPAVSNRIPEDFPDPDAFVPERYLEPRAEDRANPWTWIPFGAGRHRCVGAPFAMMQLKAIFSVLLRHWDFELAQHSDTYRNDHSKMVVQLAQPCVARFRRTGRRHEGDRRPRPVPGSRGV